MWMLFSQFDTGNRPTPGMIFFKGGGAPKAPKQKKVDLPKAPKPLPPPPPATEVRMDTNQVTKDVYTREAKKRGIGATLLAGETGGADAPGKRTLLG